MQFSVEARGRLYQNKRNVVAFYEMMINDCKPAEAIQLYVGDDYLQHNVHVASGKQDFIDFFERMAVEFPGKHVDIKRSFAEDNHVILHCHQVWPERLHYAGIDIFRLDDTGMIVEHWDVLQEIPDDSANDIGGD